MNFEGKRQVTSSEESWRRGGSQEAERARLFKTFGEGEGCTRAQSSFTPTRAM
jgi:hypothetical protein